MSPALARLAAVGALAYVVSQVVTGIVLGAATAFLVVAYDVPMAAALAVALPPGLPMSAVLAVALSFLGARLTRDDVADPEGPEEI